MLCPCIVKLEYIQNIKIFCRKRIFKKDALILLMKTNSAADFNFVDGRIFKS